MAQEPYNDDTRSVKKKRPDKERVRRELLSAMGYITTEDVLLAFKTSKAKLAEAKASGLKSLGFGKQRVYRHKDIDAVLQILSELDSPEATDGQA